MAVYSFYIFDRHTECIYTKTWLPPATSAPDGGGGPQGPTAAQHAPQQHQQQQLRTSSADDAKLIFGTVFSLRNMVRKLGGEDDAFVAFRTAHYKLHYYETASSLRLVMLTDTATPSMRNVLHQVYINLWLEYVVKNPLSPVEHKGGAGVKNELFELALDQFIRGLM
ncbi:Longin-like domain-containing protein [Chaetomium fimeti]|uniref:Trafficking protein particle complex subunit n=1 Tax=Chaetomium fimeti TaxID=1854472 RepID=A0AAE0HG62_9PEZI|nr:Longin-like domain-containing protein [Chaetomium fimeti]